jgi:hypothetical protein
VFVTELQANAFVKGQMAGGLRVTGSLYHVCTLLGVYLVSLDV